MKFDPPIHMSLDRYRVRSVVGCPAAPAHTGTPRGSTTERSQRTPPRSQAGNVSSASHGIFPPASGSRGRS